MLEFEGLQYWAIFAAWLVNIIVGAFWYSPAGFGKQWAKLSGVDHMKMPEKEASKTLGFIALSALVQAFALAVIINTLHTTTIIDGMWVGLLLWLGFVAATTVGNILYQRLGWKFWWLNSSYFLVTFLVNTILLVLWR